MIHRFTLRNVILENVQKTSILYDDGLLAVLLAIAAGRYYAVDRALTPRLGPFGFLATGKGRRTTVTAGAGR